MLSPMNGPTIGTKYYAEDEDEHGDEYNESDEDEDESGEDNEDDKYDTVNDFNHTYTGNAIAMRCILPLHWGTKAMRTTNA